MKLQVWRIFWNGQVTNMWWLYHMFLYRPEPDHAHESEKGKAGRMRRQGCTVRDITLVWSYVLALVIRTEGLLKTGQNKGGISMICHPLRLAYSYCSKYTSSVLGSQQYMVGRNTLTAATCIVTSPFCTVWLLLRCRPCPASYYIFYTFVQMLVSARVP